MDAGGGKSNPVPAEALLNIALPSGFAQETVTSGLTEPTAFAFLPDGRILIAEKRGVVKVYKNGQVLGTPFIDIRDRVNDYWDHGLLGLAVDPNFATNGFVYLLFTFENKPNDNPGYYEAKTGRLARYTASGDTASKNTELVVLGTQVGDQLRRLPRGGGLHRLREPLPLRGQRQVRLGRGALRDPGRRGPL